MIALSCDSVEDHQGWINDIKAYNGLTDFSYPIIADPSREVAKKYGMLDPVAKDNAGIPLTCRYTHRDPHRTFAKFHSARRRPLTIVDAVVMDR